MSSSYTFTTNPDLSGTGIRVVIYVHAFVKLFYIRIGFLDRRLYDNGLIFSFLGIALIVNTFVQLFSSQGISIIDGVVVTLLAFIIITAQIPFYLNSRRPLLSRLAQLSWFSSITLAYIFSLFYWIKVDTFGNAPQCNASAQFVLFGHNLSMTSNSLRIAALVFINLGFLSAIYGFVARVVTYAYKQRLERALSLEEMRGRARTRKSTIYFGIYLVIGAAYIIFFITTTEQIIATNDIHDAQWSFGEVFAMLLLIPPLVDLFELFVASIIPQRFLKRLPPVLLPTFGPSIARSSLDSPSGSLQSVSLPHSMPAPLSISPSSRHASSRPAATMAERLGPIVLSMSHRASPSPPPSLPPPNPLDASVDDPNPPPTSKVETSTTRQSVPQRLQDVQSDGAASNNAELLPFLFRQKVAALNILRLARSVRTCGQQSLDLANRAVTLVDSLNDWASQERNRTATANDLELAAELLQDLDKVEELIEERTKDDLQDAQRNWNEILTKFREARTLLFATKYNAFAPYLQPEVDAFDEASRRMDRKRLEHSIETAEIQAEELQSLSVPSSRSQAPIHLSTSRFALSRGARAAADTLAH